MRFSGTLILSVLGATALASTEEPCATTLRVDLGYAVHEATLDVSLRFSRPNNSD